MLTLNFTGKRKSSGGRIAYFDPWNRLFGWESYVEDDYSVERGDKLSEVFTTDQGRSFSSYFSGVSKLNRRIRWIFGDRSNAIELHELQYQNGREGYFLNNIFDLGDGRNSFQYVINFEEGDPIAPSIKYRLKSKGYKATIVGGRGSDYISLDLDKDSDFSISNKSLISIKTSSGDDHVHVNRYGNLSLGLNIQSGRGADEVDISNANSSFVNAGQGKDFLYLGRKETNDLAQYRLFEKAKDVILGGGGSDSFIFNYNYNDDQSSYTLGGDKDFCVIEDYQKEDNIIVYGGGKLSVDGRNGTLNLSATSSYSTRVVDYTSRLYMNDDLVAYIAGDQIQLRDIIQY